MKPVPLFQTTLHALVAGLLFLAPGSVMAASDENPKPVEVVNFPEAQDISGTVSVDNFPATQAVSGTVAVSNFPATQTVQGTVDVGNFPAVVESSPPAPVSDRLSFNFDTIGPLQGLLAAPAGVIVTDVVWEFRKNGDFFCVLTIYDGALVSENIMLQPIVQDRELSQISLNSGLQGPLNFSISVGGSGSGRCAGDIFWTGYIP